MRSFEQHLTYISGLQYYLTSSNSKMEQYAYSYTYSGRLGSHPLNGVILNNLERPPNPAFNFNYQSTICNKYGLTFVAPYVIRAHAFVYFVVVNIYCIIYCPCHVLPARLSSRKSIWKSGRTRRYSTLNVSDTVQNTVKIEY